ncbi:hypothetical protein AB6A23_03945 [Paenibacillus tarimensis]
MRLKIEEACRLLQARPELKIRELWNYHALSFSDQHYFYRVFKGMLDAVRPNAKSNLGSTDE